MDFETQFQSTHIFKYNFSTHIFEYSFSTHIPGAVSTHTVQQTVSTHTFQVQITKHTHFNPTKILKKQEKIALYPAALAPVIGLPDAPPPPPNPALDIGTPPIFPVGPLPPPAVIIGFGFTAPVDVRCMYADGGGWLFTWEKSY